MGAFNTKDKYGAATIVLHWLLFLLIAGLLAGGSYFASLPGKEKIPMLIGVAVLMLMLFRLLWKLAKRRMWFGYAPSK
ncbi:MAG: hypothetical protein ACR2P4_01050 [Gammaproteobacteria bacterium]